MNCINCGEAISSNFCPNCGQKSTIAPLTWRGIFGEFSSRWLGMDNKFGRTVRDLVTRPHVLIQSYLDGNRVKYMGPLGFMVVMSALMVFTFSLTGIEVDQYMKAISESFAMQPPATDNADPEKLELLQKQQAFTQEFLKKMAANMRLLSGAIIPFLALALMMFYRKHSFVQNFVIATYITAQTVWVSIIGILAFALFNQLIVQYMFVITIAYTTYALARFYRQENHFTSIVRALFSYAVGYILFIITMMVFTIVALIIALMPS